ncbi:hypothetical protein PJN35_29715, partial [Mycobacterium kansasii]
MACSEFISDPINLGLNTNGAIVGPIAVPPIHILPIKIGRASWGERVYAFGFKTVVGRGVNWGGGG